MFTQVFYFLENLKAIKLANPLFRMAQLSLLTSIWYKISFNVQCSGSGKRQEYVRVVRVCLIRLCFAKYECWKSNVCKLSMHTNVQRWTNYSQLVRTHTYLAKNSIIKKNATSAPLLTLISKDGDF